MELSTGGLVGALVGLVLGWIDYKVVGGLVVGALRRTDRSATAAEKSDYERRIRLFRIVFFVGSVGFFPVLGYVLGQWLAG